MDAIELVQGLMALYIPHTRGAVRTHCVMSRFLDRLVRSRFGDWTECVAGVSVVRHFAIDLSVEWETDYLLKVAPSMIEQVVWSCVGKTRQREVLFGFGLNRWNPLNWWRILFPPLH